MSQDWFDSCKPKGADGVPLDHGEHSPERKLKCPTCRGTRAFHDWRRIQNMPGTTRCVSRGCTGTVAAHPFRHPFSAACPDCAGVDDRKPMTAERLAEIRKRHAESSAGPWRAGHASWMTYWGREADMTMLNVSVYQAEADRLLHLMAGPPWDEEPGKSTSRAFWENGHIQVVGERSPEDAAFIAHAHQDIPDMLSELERLTADNARMRAALGESVELLRGAREMIARGWGGTERDHEDGRELIDKIDAALSAGKGEA